MSAMASAPAEMIDRPHRPASLFDYQKIGIARLVQQRFALFADEIGLGKTIPAIAARRFLLGAEPFGAARFRSGQQGSRQPR